MAADASIYGQVGRIRSVADYDRDALALQNAQQQSELNSLQLLTGKAGLAEKQRQSQEQNALRTLLGDASFNRKAPDAAARLYQVAPGAADSVIKGWQAQDKADADIGKLKADTDSVLLDQANKKLSRLKEYIGTAANPQQVAEVLKSADADPHLGPVLRMQGSLQDQMAQLQSLQSPEQFQMWQLQRSKGVDDLLKFTTPDANAKLTAATSKENNAANNARQAADNAAQRAVQLQGQRLSDARAREANMTQRELVNQQKQLQVNELQDKADARNRAKDAAASSVVTQVANIDRALTHPGRETGTGLSSVIDPRNAIPGTDARDFRAVADQLKGAAFLQAFESLKGGGAITEIEGKKAEAAIARLDTAQSDGEYAVALNELRSIMGDGYKRLTGKELPTATPVAAPAGGAARIKSDAEYNALPSGATFVGPDGKTRRKP